MGRFSHLEFEGEKPPPQPAPAAAPGDELRWLAEGAARFREGRFDAALRAYSRALECDKPTAEAWLGQVLALIEMDEANEARVWSEKGLEAFPDDPELTAAKAVAAARLQDEAAAMAHSDHALQAPGASAWRWRARGEVLLARSDKSADFCFGKAAAIRPAEAAEPLAIARAYLRWEKAAPALRWAETAVARGAGEPFAWETLGLCRERLGMAALAGQAYRRALDFGTERPASRAGLARLEREGLWVALGRRFRSWWQGR